jgi:uncharacterized protein (DUF934 family)
MALVKDGRAVADSWVAVADDAPVPADVPALVGFARWQAGRDALLAGRTAPLGVRATSATLAEALAPALADVALVALEFPKFRDGRAFSTARELRERHGFTGEIRAVGHVIPDQYLFLVHCGFTTVEVPDGANLDTWAAALKESTAGYVTDRQSTEPLAFLRRHAAASSGG